MRKIWVVTLDPRPGVGGVGGHDWFYEEGGAIQQWEKYVADPALIDDRFRLWDATVPEEFDAETITEYVTDTFVDNDPEGAPIRDNNPFDTKVLLEIDNIYVGGPTIHTSVEAMVPKPPLADEDELDEWAWEYVMEHTGTGRTKGDAAYFVKVVESSEPGLVGREFEFGT